MMAMLFDKEFFESKFVEPENRVPVDTLILVGNGFDVWQGLNTKYAAFENYYDEHIDQVLSRLHIPKRTLTDKEGNAVLDSEGNPVTFCDVELFYGDPNQPKKLPHSFWYDFETSLDKVDDQEINYFFGRSKEGIQRIQSCANNAQRILREIFSDWIMSIDIDARETEYDFGNSLFINFNYTDTLLKRFGVKEINEYHIHGSAADKNSILFGHSTHPEYPYSGLQMGPKHPRYQGLYYIEEFLYNADKHTEDNYMKLRIFLALHGVKVEDIKKIYVLGLGFGPADVGYIKNLINATQGVTEDREADLTEEERFYLDMQDPDGEKHLNIEYAASHRERVMKAAPISYPELEKQDAVMNMFMTDPYYHISREDQMRLQTAAVRRRYWEEQEERNKKMTREFLRLLNKKLKCGYITPEQSGLEADEETVRNLTGAEWHISYYNADDEKRIRGVMTEYGCKNYTLHSSIDECVSEFRKS